MKFVQRDITTDNAKRALLIQRSVLPHNYHTKSYIRDYLINVYHNKCCYCEIAVKSAYAAFQVDHFYPVQTGNGTQNNKPVYDICNFHVSCPRCNNAKKTYTGPALSPNYYLDAQNNWQMTRSNYIEDHIEIKGPFITSSKYQDFIDALKLNGLKTRNGYSHLASILERARYLYKTQKEIENCSKLAKKGDVHAKELFAKIEKKFDENAQFSTILITNYGKSFLKLRKDVNKRPGIISLVSNIYSLIKDYFSNK